MAEQVDWEKSGVRVCDRPGRIPWSVHFKAWEAYAREYGRGQTAERLAERGGFWVSELDEHHATWREEVEEIPLLRKRIAFLEAEVEWINSAESWICPQCGSVDTDEFFYADDFGSRKCNACCYTGDPGEDFPVANVLMKRIADLEEQHRKDCAEFERLVGERESLREALHAARKEGNAAHAILKHLAECAVFVSSHGMSAAPAECWREVHAFLQDPERYAEATHEPGRENEVPDEGASNG